MTAEFFKKTKKIKKAVQAAALAAVLAASSPNALADAASVEKQGSREGINVTEINGVKCRPKTRMKTYLFMGVDNKGDVTAVESEEDSSGQCDVLQLLVIDQNANTYAIVPINRNTITAVKSLEDDGTYIATSDVQIALAHANGDGLEISCENTVDAVSNLFYGVQIDGYMALNMDAIATINHLAGGVTVTIEDDFSESDPSLQMGDTVTLTDEQAMHYVHDRMNVGDGTNECRMRRQDAYMAGLQEIFMQKASENDSFVMDAYSALGEYMVTDLSKKDCSKIAKAILKNESLGKFTIDGTTSLDYLGFDEFYPYQDSLADVVLQLFYEKL